MLLKNFISQNANKIFAFCIPLCFSDMVIADNFDSIFDIARRAPSSHNAQMWKCERLSTNECIVTINQEYTLKEVDYNNREAWISIGAFVENCVKVASDFGYILNSKYDKEKILLTIQETKEKENQYIPFIRQRHTDRFPFKKDPIENNILPQEEYKYIERDSKLGKLISNNIYNANKQQLQNKEKNKELAHWTITSYKEQKNRNDGLSPKALGLSKLQRFFFFCFFNKKNMNSPLFIKQALKGTKRQINNCAGFIIISSHHSNPEEWFNTGRKLERIWLDLTKSGISVHPMSQPIEEDKYYTELKSILQEKEEIQMILRIGYPKELTSPTSKRREIN